MANGCFVEKHLGFKKMTEPLKVIKMCGPETAFVSEVLNVIERHAGELTVHQICGGLFAAAHEVLTGENEEV